ncbi:MAG: capsular biosynthesis protein [Cyanobacteria bacterium QH_8_48_120]|nr:MAG: capsular biosynthesis protein [Cyanobacteria bacterium QH_10_48_56]PSO56016.1 MAG: capsular biosynthesis protein [Cyanobacteria bacterium QH_1_48_107]PSO62365.1 MAG: capsular biosynthesis protein [Cyanobacteria bacterium QH_6_48_35]PSO70048.1 MAG: capsular biosynthesis protein [Cyanobacteria bacterium QH_8_48_120]PSO71702.1 MAG: capsular biosynthesis protein [Cyanobacteria bacterium QH_3_48_40]PSO72942.1 MAG: capsular biosynthesis protein [Cyanobacteria bacterium QS_1_48_34]
MTQSNDDATTTETEFGYGQLFAILWRRRFWFLGVFCGVLSIAIPLALSKEPTYRSSMELLVEPNYQENGGDGGESEVTDSAVDVDYATQLNLMRSSELLQEAVERLESEYPHISVEELQGSLTLKQVVEGEDEPTKIVQATYVGNDPARTKEVLQALKNVYQKYNLEQQEKRISEGLSFINEQLPVARENLAEAEQELRQFRQNNNLVAPEEAANQTANALRNVEQQRQSLDAQYQETQARYDALKKQLGLSPQEALISSRLSESSRYQTLLNQLQETEIALAEQRAQYTDAHPNVKALLEQRQQQLSLLKEEVRQVLGEVPEQLKITPEALQQRGQLAGTELNLARSLVEARTNLQSLRARDQSLAETEQQLRAQLDRFPKLIAQYNSLQQEVEVRRSTLQELLQARQQLGVELDRGGFNWQVVETPRAGHKIGPNTKQDILLGAVVGLFLGGVAAFLREVVDDAVHTSDQLRGQVSLPLLGVTPSLPPSEAGRFVVNFPWQRLDQPPTSILQVVQWLPFRESLDMIYKNIQLLNRGSELSSLVVTSALAGEGKSTLVLGLAISAARLDQRVLVIDADLRHSSLHEELALSNEEGLSTLLSGETEQPNLHHISPLGSNIDLLTAGSTPNDPVKLLSSQGMRELIAEFEQSYDLVLLDTPSILGTVDAIQTASFCSGVVMVGRLDRVTQSQLSQATTMLSKLNAIGIVANGGRDAMSSYAAVSESDSSSSNDLLPCSGGSSSHQN